MDSSHGSLKNLTKGPEDWRQHTPEYFITNPPVKSGEYDKCPIALCLDDYRLMMKVSSINQAIKLSILKQHVNLRLSFKKSDAYFQAHESRIQRGSTL